MDALCFGRSHQILQSGITVRSPIKSAALWRAAHETATPRKQSKAWRQSYLLYYQYKPWYNTNVKEFFEKL